MDVDFTDPKMGCQRPLLGDVPDGPVAKYLDASLTDFPFLSAALLFHFLQYCKSHRPLGLDNFLKNFFLLKSGNLFLVFIFSEKSLP